ncbi:MAG: sulfur transferase domain-containing protein [Parvularculaceae bacterium]|nr:sulfur transferase domain-containing protein [Parvularculaceae bacterium]
MSAPSPLSREDLKTPEGRKRARRDFAFGDHAALRALYDNSHEIAPGVWRSFQPSPAHIARWAKRGIRTIVNLRGDKPSAALFLEEEACAKHGLALVTLRLFSREAPSAATLRALRAMFDRIDYPAVFHCKSGADRVGLGAAMYLFMKAGRPLDEALKQLSLRYGHVRAGKTGVIDAAFDAYRAHARASDIPLTDVEAFLRWAESPAYDPAAIKAGHKGRWWGNFLTEKVLRRE